jgi:hypothetical protein
MSNPRPGAALLIAAFSLFGAFTAIAWSEDIRRGASYEPPASEHVCDRLAYELDQQEAIKLIKRDERNAIVFRCWRDFK